MNSSCLSVALNSIEWLDPCRANKRTAPNLKQKQKQCIAMIVMVTFRTIETIVYCKTLRKSGRKSINILYPILIVIVFSFLKMYFFVGLSKSSIHLKFRWSAHYFMTMSINVERAVSTTDYSSWRRRIAHVSYSRSVGCVAIALSSPVGISEPCASGSSLTRTSQSRIRIGQIKFTPCQPKRIERERIAYKIPRFSKHSSVLP